MTTKTYRVGGMTCDGCMRSVTKAIGRAAPGARVSVDLATGRVTIDGDAPEPAIARAVEGAGFAFEGAA